jgi:hypothetical protein
VYYYKNHCFPNGLSNACVNAIADASILICCGYLPDEKIVSMMKNVPLTFIGDNKTIYRKDDDDVDGHLVNMLHATPSLFESYIRFDYPQLYRYWVAEDIEENNVANFKVTKHSSLQDLYDTSVRTVRTAV